MTGTRTQYYERLKRRMQALDSGDLRPAQVAGIARRSFNKLRKAMQAKIARRRANGPVADPPAAA